MDSSFNQESGIKIYHELMANKVGDILLVSSPYDAFIMEEEGRLSNRIIHEYKGLNLSRPPRLTWVSSAAEAFDRLEKKNFDLILAMPSLDGMDVQTFGEKVKQQYADLPFFMLLHNTCDINQYLCMENKTAIDRTYVWGGNADLLLAIIKNFEDEKNVAFDTDNANVRVIIMVEDSPYHYSAILPVIYKQIVLQTQSVIDESINEEHRLLKMRGRPKVLLAQTYEEALSLYETYKPYVLSIFSDMRFPRNGTMDENAGFHLLRRIKKDVPDLPLLVISTEERSRDLAYQIPAVFINKNSANLNDRIKTFFVGCLGFGAFVFRRPTGEEVARASDLRAIEKLLPEIPDESIVFHAKNNDFSRWLLARSEISLAMNLKPYTIDDFPDPKSLKRFLIDSIRTRRRGTRQGQVIEFDSRKFDSDTGFMKIGNGSLGGKARGLAFMASQIKQDDELIQKFPEVDIHIPQTFVIATDGFKTFIEDNNLARLLESGRDLTDEMVVKAFINARFPDWLKNNLKVYLEHVNYPIAVRSSSLFEDAHYQPFAGLYKTYMLPNTDTSLDTRLERLIMAVKLVYASTYMKAPRAYAQSTMHRTEDEEMAVILQELTGIRHNNYFYPSIAGVAQSYNFYPIAHLKADEGIAYIAMGLGKIVMEGGKTLRFCPRYPQFLPQFSMVEDILENSQKYFYALKMDVFPPKNHFLSNPAEDPTLAHLELMDAVDHPIVRQLCSTFHVQDNRIRDVYSDKGYPVLTFAGILKYNSFPLAQILAEVTRIGSRWMGSSVEVEFAVNLHADGSRKPEFSLLQIRPMGRYKQNLKIRITPADQEKAFCYSVHSLGNGEYKNIHDLIYVDPDRFDPAKTVEIAREINKLNALFNENQKKYVLIGPGRWGSSDRWLGIPVAWNDISNVGVMVEATIESIKADPSQGSHFFQNITSLGIAYITVSDNTEDFIDYEFLGRQAGTTVTPHLKHIHFRDGLYIRVDGKTSRAALIPREPASESVPMPDVPMIDSAD
jgi:CheY-like chemotaxis protein